MKKLFIGIDISKDVFDYCCLSEDNDTPLATGQELNTKGGITDFLKLIRQFKSYQVLICMEHTGYYGALLALTFSQKKIDFVLLNPLELKRSMGIARGKTDSIDASRIANYALTHCRQLKPYKLPSDQLRQLKVLMSTRKQYSKISVQLKNGLKALKVISKTIDIKSQIKENQELIKKIGCTIKKIEKRMLEIINSCEELKVTYVKISKVIGVGPITATKCLIETDNFTKFTEGRKFSCHCGLAPFEYKSGSSIRGKTRTSPLHDRSLKALLFKAAATAIQHDPQIKNYYERKKKEGKHKLCALNAVANKIVLRIFAVANREEPFVKLTA